MNIPAVPDTLVVKISPSMYDTEWKMDDNVDVAHVFLSGQNGEKNVQCGQSGGEVTTDVYCISLVLICNGFTYMGTRKRGWCWQQLWHVRS
jgi:hypothetical protein